MFCRPNFTGSLDFLCVAFKNVWLNVYNGFSVGDFCGTMEQTLCIT
nr:MAG TPA: hypothetical protein [Caudoviricetes sp.]